jgi:UPF0042 nucleotide-binding protein
MNKRELILVAGISGAGKTVTMDFLDSAGYYCIDNLPIKALLETIKTLQQEDFYFQYAIGINSNADEADVKETFIKLQSLDFLEVKVLYLDVSDEVLIRRFQMTRKHHPFINQNETLLDAIEHERQMLKVLREYSNIIIDTTEYSATKLKSYLSKVFDKNLQPQFRVCFVSYGYKYGIPKDLDYAFDVRFIENPYYIEEMREKTGNDDIVYNYVMEQDSAKTFIEYLIPLLKYCIKAQQATSRSYLVIGIGCTGGKHRSVSIANYLTDYFKDEYTIIKDHRDIER